MVRTRSSRITSLVLLAALSLLPLAVGFGLRAAHAAAPGLTASVLSTGSIEVGEGAVFDAIFDIGQEGGISKLYDLATDPGKTVNLGPTAGYTVFNHYVNDGPAWADIGGGNASLLELLRATPSSVLIHSVGNFMREDGSGAVGGLQHETWTTIYPGGRVFIQRRLRVGATAVSLQNFGGKAIDVSTSATWYGIFTGVASDTSYPNSSNGSVGNGKESWLGFWQSGVSAGQKLSVGMESWQAADYGFTASTIRMLVGNASRRSHEAQRTETTVNLAANTIYSAQFSGWMSPFVRTQFMNSSVADFRQPALTLTSGTAAVSDSEPLALTTTSGYNPGIGAYVVASTASGVAGQIQFPTGVVTRYRPDFKVSGWPNSTVAATLGSTALTSGTDYLADVDAAGNLRLVFLKDVVAAAPGAGQLSNGMLSLSPSGVAPSPNPTPSPSPTPTPTPNPTAGAISVVMGPSTIEVTDGNTFDALFDRNQGGGITALYDLTTDSAKTVNLGPQAGYTVFNSYMLDAQAPNKSGSWALIGSTTASVFETTNVSPESVTVHVVTPYGCEVIEAVNCYFTDVRAESWTTIYPGGHVFFERHILTGAGGHTLANAAPASVDLCHCSNWYGILQNGTGDNTYPSGTNIWAGKGTEGWYGQYQVPGTAAGKNLGVLEVPYQDKSFGLTYTNMRMIIGTAYLRSHIVPRTENTVTLAPNTTYIARYRGLISGKVSSAIGDAVTADYRTPGLVVSTGAVANSDPEMSGTSIIGGYDPATGRYVLLPDASGHANVTLTVPAGVSARYRPAFKFLGWPGAGQAVSWGGVALVAGKDYQASIDSSGALRLNLAFDVVAANPGPGQRVNAALNVVPAGATPTPTPTPTPSPTPGPSPTPTPTPTPSPTPTPTPTPTPSPTPGPSPTPTPTPTPSPTPPPTPTPTPSSVPYAAPGTLLVSAPSAGIIAVQSSRYRLEFDGSDAGGAPNVWYDLINDPGKTQNLAAKGTTTLGYHNAANYPLVDSWFDVPFNGVDTWFHTAGPATVLEVTEQSPEHVVLHTISAFYAEQTPAQKAPEPIDVERYWTLYPDGSVFVRQTIRNQADLNHHGFIAWAINGNNLNQGFWSAGTEAGQGDSRWPSGSNNDDSVTGNWWAQYGTCSSAVNHGAVLIDVRDINNPGPSNTTRAIVGTGDRPSSHLAVRIDNAGRVPAGNYVESAWLRLDQTLNAATGDPRESSTFGNRLDADYRTAPVTVATGTLATTDSFAGGVEPLVNGVNLATGRVVVAAASNHVNLTPMIGASSPVRYGLRLRITGWTGGTPVVTWGGATLQAGTDYNAQIEANSTTLYVQLLFDVVGANAAQGQRLAAALDVMPAQ